MAGRRGRGRRYGRDGTGRHETLCLCIVAGLTREQAIDLEKDMIRLLGREPLGPLVNRTDGGEGCENMSMEGRAAIAKANQTREWKEETLAILAEQRAQRNRERKWSEESRVKVSKRSKGNKFASLAGWPAERRAAMSKFISSRPRLPESSAKQAASLKLSWARRKAAANPVLLKFDSSWYSSHVEKSPTLAAVISLV
jgi:hypothetical protein